MKKKKGLIVILVLVMIIISVSTGVIIGTNKNNNKRVVSGYSFELREDSAVNKMLNGKYLDSFVTVVEEQEEFNVNVEGINQESEVFIIDPTDGNMIPLEYKNDKFSGTVNLDKEINYGIIMDYKLVGSIRVVEDIKDIDESQLFNEILVSLGCGI